MKSMRSPPKNFAARSSRCSRSCERVVTVTSDTSWNFSPLLHRICGRPRPGRQRCDKTRLVRFQQWRGRKPAPFLFSEVSLRAGPRPGNSGQPPMKKNASALRCPWATTPLNIDYHDTEWGVPLHDDRSLFELLTLEGAQAGLSWSTILAKRPGYRRAFDHFDARKIVHYDQTKIDAL